MLTTVTRLSFHHHALALHFFSFSGDPTATKHPPYPILQNPVVPVSHDVPVFLEYTNQSKIIDLSKSKGSFSEQTKKK